MTIYTTDQQIFDAVADHLLKQGRRARDPISGGCRYRAEQPDGTVLKCAVGALIPDDRYAPDLENYTISTLINLSALRSSVQTPNLARTVSLLRAVQRVHDATFTGPTGWKRELCNVAREFELNTRVLNAQA